MSLFVILEAAQAEAVRGPTTPPSALDPIARLGGVFILPLAVLDDPAHALHHELLLQLPQMDSGDPAFPAALEA